MPVGPGGNDRGMATPACVLPQLCLTWMGLSPPPIFYFFFDWFYFKLQWAGQRAPRNITFLLWNAFNSLPISTVCISGWQGSSLSQIPVCPPIGARCKEPGYILDSPRLRGPHHVTEEEERRSREQCPLFSPSSRSVSSVSYVT